MFLWLRKMHDDILDKYCPIPFNRHSILYVIYLYSIVLWFLFAGLAWHAVDKM